MIQDVKKVGYDKMFSECQKGKIPTETRLDTEALINLLMLENVSEIEASIRKGCIRATHFIGSDKKYQGSAETSPRPQVENRLRQLFRHLRQPTKLPRLFSTCPLRRAFYL